MTYLSLWKLFRHPQAKHWARVSFLELLADGVYVEKWLRLFLARLFVLISFVILSSCATSPDVAVDPTATYSPPRITAKPVATRTAGVFTASDDAELGYFKYWKPATRADVALVYLHGIESHSGWFDIAADLLVGHGYEVYTLDRRGSGINRENRGFDSGHTDAISTLISDIQSFLRPLRSRYDAVYLVGLSWGGKLALGYALQHVEDIDGLILITPGLKALVDISFGAKIKVVVASVMAPKTPIALPIEADMFTKTPSFLQYIHNDPLRLRYASARFLMEGVRLERIIDQLMPTNQHPILLFLAANDRIIDNAGVVQVLAPGDPDLLEVLWYENQTHSIQFDAPYLLVADMVTWIDRQQRVEAAIKAQK